MEYGDLRSRFRHFAVGVFEALDLFPGGVGSRVVQHQLARSASSAAANYRAAQRATSRAEFLSKLHVAFEETDESAFWLEFAVASKLVSGVAIAGLTQEADELCAILARSQKTARIRAVKPQ